MNHDIIESRIHELNDLLHEATRFSEPWDYFHEHLVGDPRFHALGEQGRDALLESSLSAVCQALTAPEEEPRLFGAIHVEEHGLWHGLLYTDGRPVIFFYFEDGDTGLVGLPADDDCRVLARFSRLQLPVGTTLGDRGSA